MPAAPTAPFTVQESVASPLADSPLPVSTLPENLPLRKNKGKKYQEKKYQDSLPSPFPIYPIYPSSREKFVGILEWNSCLAKYKRQVEYDTLLFDHPEWKERLDELLELMTEASCALRPPSALADARSPPRWCGRGMPRSICSSWTTSSTSSTPPSSPSATSGSICGRYSSTRRPLVPTNTTPAFAGISTGKIKATPRNCVCGLRPIFCPIRSGQKGGNTYSIPALFSLSAEPKSLAECSCQIARCCLKQ